MKQRIICKGLAVAVILLFLGLAVQPSVATVQQEVDFEPKEYLFQTIIDIANNPELKELLQQYKYDLFKVDIDRSVYRKLLLKNPRLFFNTILTKPSMSIEYLDKCYKNGIEITNILGEDKVLEILENVEVTDTKLFDELNNIITKDEELSGRVETLKEMNKKLITDWNFPFICSILLVLFSYLYISGIIRVLLIILQMETLGFYLGEFLTYAMLFRIVISDVINYIILNIRQTLNCPIKI